jgi:hypothetical protein
VRRMTTSRTTAWPAAASVATRRKRRTSSQGLQVVDHPDGRREPQDCVLEPASAHHQDSGQPRGRSESGPTGLTEQLNYFTVFIRAR